MKLKKKKKQKIIQKSASRSSFVVFRSVFILAKNFKLFYNLFIMFCCCLSLLLIYSHTKYNVGSAFLTLCFASRAKFC